MTLEYGRWSESLTIGDIQFRADRIDEGVAKRAGFAVMFALRGLPISFEDNLVRAAQVCDVPHTWRVKECQSEGDVTAELLAAGKDVLARDRLSLGSSVVTYVGSTSEHHNSFEFVAAGAIRNRLTKDFENDQFPVVSRAIVAPKFRGKGIGTLIVEHRTKAVIRGFFTKPAKAIHFGTESEKVLSSIKKVERDERVRFVYIGDEQYRTEDGLNTVHDYLCFLPWYQKLLLETCDRLVNVSENQGSVRQFRTKLDAFMREGVRAVTGTDLQDSFKVVKSSVSAENEIMQSLSALDEVFTVRKKIGAEDPHP